MALALTVSASKIGATCLHVKISQGLRF